MNKPEDGHTDHPLMPLVDRVLSLWRQGLTVGKVRRIAGVTQLDVFAITQADAAGKSPEEIAIHLPEVTHDMDAIDTMMAMGIPIDDPDKQRRKNWLTARWLEIAFSGGHPDPLYDPEAVARETDW